MHFLLGFEAAPQEELKPDVAVISWRLKLDSVNMCYSLNIEYSEIKLYVLKSGLIKIFLLIPFKLPLISCLKLYISLNLLVL